MAARVQDKRNQNTSGNILTCGATNKIMDPCLTIQQGEKQHQWSRTAFKLSHLRTFERFKNGSFFCDVRHKNEGERIYNLT